MPFPLPSRRGGERVCVESPPLLCRLCHSSPCRGRSPPRLSPAEPERVHPARPNAWSTSASLRAPVSRACSARRAYLGIRQLIDLREHQRRLILKGRLHRFEVTFRIFSGTILKSQVAQIVVDGVAALQQLIELRSVRCKIRSIWLNVKNEQHGRGSQGQARSHHRPIRGINQEYRECAKSSHHQS